MLGSNAKLADGKQRREAEQRHQTKVVARRHVAEEGDGAERRHDRRPDAAEDHDADIIPESKPVARDLPTEA